MVRHRSYKNNTTKDVTYQVCNLPPSGPCCYRRGHAQDLYKRNFFEGQLGGVKQIKDSTSTYQAWLRFSTGGLGRRCECTQTLYLHPDMPGIRERPGWCGKKGSPVHP